MACSNEQSARFNERTRKLIAQLNSADETERAAAEQAVREMGPVEIGPVFEKLNREIDCWMLRGFVGFAILYSIAEVVLREMHIITLGRFEYCFKLAAFGLLSTLGMLLLFQYGVGPFKYKRLLQTLAKTDDVRYVGKLTYALRVGEKGIRPVTEAALIRLLPRLQANEGTFLDAEQRGILRSVLRRNIPSGKNIELVLAVLKAFEQIGDKSDIPIVQKLAVGKTKNGKEECVRQAAQECLLFLQERIEGLSPDRTLLRASTTEAVSSDVLLRPAVETQATDPQQLLRANVAASSTATQMQVITQENIHA